MLEAVLIRILLSIFGGADGSPPLTARCLDVTIPAGTTYYVSSGDVWGVLALTVEAGAELRIDGEVHCWDDVTGPGIITGEGELRLH